MDYTQIRKLREKADLTLYELSQEIGISYSYLNKIENGYQKEIKNYKKRKAVDIWLRNALRRENRKKSA